MHPNYLKKALFIGGGRLLVLQSISLISGVWLGQQNEIGSYVQTAVVIVQAIVAGLICASTLYHVYSSKASKQTVFSSDAELPTVSVLIPARNEDYQLEEAIRAVLANDYPKLEILVLDDCSVGKRIPEIVKNFAHDGVRFIQGESPRENWLAKNQAYDTLASSASGEWLLYMGVDVRLGLGSVRALIQHAVHRKVHMLSILPHRFPASIGSSLDAPLRYFWQLALPRFLYNRPPVLSTAWLIQKDAYNKIGGMSSVARTVIPEGVFSRILARNKHYAFVRSDSYLQVATSKSLKEQHITSVRTLYPQLHKRLEWVSLCVIFILVFLIGPFVQLLSAASLSTWVVIISGVSALLMTLSHVLIVAISNPIAWPFALVNLPFLLLQEVVLIVISAYKYEFDEVIWKGRNVCLPVMHVVPHLPKID
jgi:hypothetical protein